MAAKWPDKIKRAKGILDGSHAFLVVSLLQEGDDIRVRSASCGDDDYDGDDVERMKLLIKETQGILDDLRHMCAVKIAKHPGRN